MASKAGVGEGQGEGSARALTCAGEAYVGTGVEALLERCQGPSEGLFPMGR